MPAGARASWKKKSAATAGSPCGADAHVLFDLPIEERYNAAIKLLGIDPMMLAFRSRSCVKCSGRRQSLKTVLGFDFGIKRIGIAMGNTLTGAGAAAGRDQGDRQRHPLRRASAS